MAEGWRSAPQPRRPLLDRPPASPAVVGPHQHAALLPGSHAIRVQTRQAPVGAPRFCCHHSLLLQPILHQLRPLVDLPAAGGFGEPLA